MNFFFDQFKCNFDERFCLRSQLKKSTHAESQKFKMSNESSKLKTQFFLDIIALSESSLLVLLNKPKRYAEILIRI